MFRPLVHPLATAAALLAVSSAAQAQFFSGGCSSCGQNPAPMMAPALPAATSYGYNPCNLCGPPVAFNPCVTCAQPVAMVQPVTQTVFQDVPVTKYRPVQKTVQRPVVKWVNEQRPVTAYRQVVETKTVEVPSTAYQTITECQPQIINNSRWQTTYQRVPKMSPCQYDPNPTLLGWLNRAAYSTRMAFTPNYIRQRQFVPNMVAYNVPVTRTVAVPTSRTVTYNVARLEPYQSTQTVAVAKVEYEDVPVTAYEPYTETVRMAVGSTTTYAFVDPFGGTTTTALAPTPDSTISSRTAANPTPATGTTPSPTPAGGTDLFKPLSHPRPVEAQPAPVPTYLDARSTPTTEADETVVLARTSGWRARRSPSQPAPAPSLPAPSAAALETNVALATRN